MLFPLYPGSVHHGHACMHMYTHTVLQLRGDVSTESIPNRELNSILKFKRQTGTIKKQSTGAENRHWGLQLRENWLIIKTSLIHFKPPRVSILISNERREQPFWDCADYECLRAAECAQVFACLISTCTCMSEILKVSLSSVTVVCDLFRQSTKSDWYDNWNKKNTQVSHCIFIHFTLFSQSHTVYHHPIDLPLPISLCPSLHLFPHFPIHSSQPPNHIIIIFSLSLTRLSPPADRQCRHTEVNWDVAAVTGPLYWLVHLHHPSQCPHRAQTHTHTHTHCLQQEETCPGPRPKLITLPWWSGPVNLTRPQPWREKERIPSVSVSTQANVETINKKNRRIADLSTQ